jgi:1-acyl-sn-glycerol-3-phosphate acyltransferase
MARLARWLLRAAGWRLVGEPPDIPRCLVIFAPHTSNWDFPLLLLVRFAAGRRVSYLAKHTLFRFPFAWFFRATGALPVERGEHHDLVTKLAQAFHEQPELWLAMSPEGTRARTDHWKSGFYHIALEAGVPVLLAFIDARRRECGLGELVELTGDVERDLGRIATFYGDKQGIVPERTSEIRFQGAELQD